jgi:prepilin-type N-terminal cleavage/methylation domain-containing protein
VIPGRSRISARGAFTLIEVLAALAIFGLTAIVLGSAYLNILNSYRAVGLSTEDAQDVAFARQALLTQIDFQTAENGDEFDTPDGHHVQWSLDPNITAASATVTDLFTVGFVCEISDTATSQPRKYSETFMLLRPTWSEAATRAQVRQAEVTRIAQAQGLQQ